AEVLRVEPDGLVEHDARLVDVVVGGDDLAPRTVVVVLEEVAGLQPERRDDRLERTAGMALEQHPAAVADGDTKAGLAIMVRRPPSCAWTKLAEASGCSRKASSTASTSARSSRRGRVKATPPWRRGRPLHRGGQSRRYFGRVSPETGNPTMTC